MSAQISMLTDELSDKDKKLIIDALEALLRERSIAFRIALDAVPAKGNRQFNVHDFGLPDILRLSRIFGNQDSSHCLNEVAEPR
jgi:Ni,Fe-hydrogenase maturation factor